MNRLYLCVACFFVSWMLTAQTSSESSFQAIAASIEREYQIRLAYDSDFFENLRLTMPEDATLEAKLDKLAEQAQLSYKIKDDVVLIRPLSDNEPRYYSISGVVRGEENNEPLELANIHLVGTNYGTMSDKSGRFSFRAKATPADRFVVQISYLGFEPFEVVVIPQASAHIEATLKSEEQLFESIIVEQRASTIGLNAYRHTIVNTLDSNNNMLVQNVTADVFRGLQLFPGINAANDLSSRISIRGGEADESLIILDGMTLYKSDHVYSIFSNLNANTIGSVGLYKNAFPAQYGGRTSGVVNIDSKNLIGMESRVKATVGTLTSDIVAVVDVAPNVGIMVAGRTTTRDLGGSHLFDALDQSTTVNQQEGLDEDDVVEVSQIQPSVDFYDLNAKVQWQPSRDHQLQLTAFKSRDDYQYEDNKEYEVEDRHGREVPLVKTFQEVTEWENNGVGLTHNWRLGKGKSLTSMVGLSQFEDESTFSSIANYVNQNERRIPWQASRDSSHNSIESIQAKVMYSNQLSLYTHFDIGYEFNSYDVKSELLSTHIRDYSADNSESLHAIFGQFEHHFDKRLYTNIGLRLNNYGDEIGMIDVSPRVLVGYELLPNVKLNASYGHYYQYIQEGEAQTQYGKSIDVWQLAGNGDTQVSESDHLTIGANWITDWFSAYIDFYYKVTDGVTQNVLIDYIHPSSGGDGSSLRARREVFVGKQYVSGVDLLIKRDWRNYSTWLSYTLSENQHQFDEINDGQRFYSDEDSRHQIKWVNEWRVIDNLSLQATYVFASGRTYTDMEVNVRESRREHRPLLSIQEYQQRLPDYHRLDIGATYSFDVGLTRMTAGVQVFNVFDQSNILYKEYLFKYQDRSSEQDVVFGTEISQLGFTPQLYFSIEF